MKRVQLTRNHDAHKRGKEAPLQRLLNPCVSRAVFQEKVGIGTSRCNKSEDPEDGSVTRVGEIELNNIEVL